MATSLFLAVFFIFSVVHILIKWSLSVSKKQIVIQIGISVVLCLVFYPISLNLTQDQWMHFLTNKNSITSVAIVQILESISMLILCVYTLREKVFYKKNNWLSLVEYVPSVVFIGGLFFLQLTIFTVFNGYDYAYLNAFFILGIILFSVLGIIVLRFLLPEWEFRTELSFMVSLMQLFIAMFLPLIVEEISVPYSQFVIDKTSILITGSVFLVLLGMGFLRRRFFPQITFSKIFHLS